MTTWIWEQCNDEYGLCIRQYTICLASLAMTIYSAVLTLLFHKKHLPILRFQLIPLTINILTSTAMFFLTVFRQLYSTNLVMLIIEVYSYSLFTYTYTSIFYRTQKINTLKAQKRLNLIMMVFTFVIFAGIVTVSVLGSQQIIQCREEHGTAQTIIVFLLIFLYIITLWFIRQTKKQLKDQLSSQYTQEHLMSTKDDQYVQMKLTQSTLTASFFTISVLLHLAQLLIFYVFDEELHCYGNAFAVQNIRQLLLLTFEDIAEILPLFAIPTLLVLFPSCYNKKADPIYFSNNLVDQNTQIQQSAFDRSNLIPDYIYEKNAREKLTKM